MLQKVIYIFSSSFVSFPFIVVGTLNHTKRSRTQGVSGGGLQLIRPPLDESFVSRIMEMGFFQTKVEDNTKINRQCIFF
jgi:hypothetical protein